MESITSAGTCIYVRLHYLLDSPFDIFRRKPRAIPPAKKASLARALRATAELGQRRAQHRWGLGQQRWGLGHQRWGGLILWGGSDENQGPSPPHARHAGSPHSSNEALGKYIPRASILKFFARCARCTEKREKVCIQSGADFRVPQESRQHSHKAAIPQLA